jgi:iron complex transport system substrate-binding protein
MTCRAWLLGATVLLTSCSSAASVGSPPPPTTTAAITPEAAPVLPVTVTDIDGSSVTISDVSRIIPVNGDIAEVVYALGLGDNVVATDISATYPDAATKTPRIGYQRALTAETILNYSPTLILADDMAGPPEVLDQLRSTGITVLTIKRLRTVDAPAAKIMAVATALGVPGRGEALVAAMQAKIDTALATAETAVAEAGRPKVLALYLRGSGVQLTFGKGSGVDVFIDAAGGTDVGTAAGIVDTQQLSEEAVIAAKPDIILVTTTGLESVGGIDGLLEIPGLANTPAGQNRRVLAYEDQYLYGFGPRTGDLLAELVTAFHAPDTTP